MAAVFEVTSWRETPLDEGTDLPRMTSATVSKTYAGDIEATSVTTWLMSYADDGSAAFVGLERVTGTFADQRGSVILQHVGTFAEGAARGTLRVVAGSGTGDLVGARGDGDFLADPSGSIRLALTFE